MNFRRSTRTFRIGAERPRWLQRRSEKSERTSDNSSLCQCVLPGHRPLSWSKNISVSAASRAGPLGRGPADTGRFFADAPRG
eukprot:1117339-Pyramimonas_sp.AAC.1